MKVFQKLVKLNRGQSMVEMAIMLPLLLLMFFGIIEFGLMLGSYVLIHDLARDGVRAGVVGADNDAIKSQIIGNSVLLDTDSAHLTITITPEYYSNRKVGDPLEVKIDYKHDVITPLIGSIVGSPVNMSAKYRMRTEKT